MHTISAIPVRENSFIPVAWTYLSSSGFSTRGHEPRNNPARRGAESLLEIARRNLRRNCDEILIRGVRDAPTYDAPNPIDERNLPARITTARLHERDIYSCEKK